MPINDYQYTGRPSGTSWADYKWQQRNPSAVETPTSGPTSRSLLNEVFDLLSIGQYTSAGLVKGNIEGGTIEGIKQGARGFAQGLSILPGWEGFREPADYSYTDALDSAGWQPKTKAGKFARGAVGFTGDVLLDPLTYVGVGALGKVAKGTQAVGKVGGKVTKEALEKASREFAEKGFKNAADNFAQMAARGSAGGLTREAAEDIVRKAGGDVASTDVDDLIKTFDDITGYSRATKDVDLSLGNAPLGKKIFGDAADKSLTVMTDAQLRNLGDKTIAPFVNSITESFYNTTLGKKFSTKTGLRRMAAQNPEELYKSMKLMQELNKANLDKVAKARAFQDWVTVNGINDLTPAEMKETIKILESPQMMKYVNAQMEGASSALDDTVRDFAGGYKSVDEVDDFAQTLGDIAAQRDEANALIDDAFGPIDMPEPRADLDLTDAQLAERQATSEALAFQEQKRRVLDELSVRYPDKIDIAMSDKSFEALKNAYDLGGTEAVMAEINKRPLKYSGFDRLVNQTVAGEFNYKSIADVREEPRQILGDMIDDAMDDIISDAERDTLRRLADEGDFGEVYNELQAFYTREELDEALKPAFDKLQNIKKRKAELRAAYGQQWIKGNRDEFAQVAGQRVPRGMQDLQDVNADFQKVLDDIGFENDALRRSIDESTPDKPYAGMLDDNGELVERAAKKADVNDMTKANPVQSDVAGSALEAMQEAEAKMKNDIFQDFKSKSDAIGALKDKYKKEGMSDLQAHKRAMEEVNAGKTIDDTVEKSMGDIIDADKQISQADAIDSATEPPADILGYSPKSVQAAYKLRQEFIRMGVEATEAGVLSEGAFNTLRDTYFPRKLTKEGAEKLGVVQEGQKGISTFVTDLFGLKPTRKADFIKKRTSGIESIIDFNNKKGYKAFSEDITSVYLARAIENEEAIFQANFSRQIIQDLGTEAFESGRIQPLLPDNKYTVAYGDLIDNVNRQAQAEVQELLRAKPELGQSLDSAGKRAFNQWYGEELNKAKNRIGEALGFNFEDQSQWAKPLVDLDAKQAQIIENSGSGTVKQMHEASAELFNHKRNVEIAKKSNQLLNTYDKFLRLWKQQVTMYIPGWHARNAVSNQFQNFLSIGGDVLDPQLQKDAYKAIRKTNHADIAFDDVTFGQLYDEAVGTGLLESGFFNVEFGGESARYVTGFDEITELQNAQKGAKSVGDVAKGIKEGSNLNPFSEDFIVARAGQTAGSFIEERDRLLHFISLRKSGMDAAQAADEVNHFLFDYDDLTVFEHTTMKRILPFYAWMKKNTALQYEQLMNQPQIYRNLAKVIGAIEGTTDREERVAESDRPKYAEDWVQLRGGEDNLFINPAQPYQDINNLGLSPTELLSRTSPAIKAPIELATNRNLYFGSEIAREGSGKSDRVNYILDYIEAIQSGRKLANPYRDDDIKRRDLLNRTSGIKFGSF